MKKIELKNIIKDKNPKFMNKYPKFIQDLFVFIINLFFREEDINNYLEILKDKKNFDFIDTLFDLLDFSFFVSSKEKVRIPSEGRLIIIANHPLGALDGLALLKIVSEIREDVCIVANDLILNIENIKELIIPINYYSYRDRKSNYAKIDDAIKNEKVVILFPSQRVSRFGWNGIKDGFWKKGAVKLSSRYQVPILPMYIDGRNSLFFYFVSLFSEKISSFLLPNEVFNKRQKDITIKIGKLISSNTFKNKSIDLATHTKLLKKHFYQVFNNKKGIFITENTIIHPISKKQLKFELAQNQIIGKTTDNKKIYLVDAELSPNILKEIGRLRELTFRKVGEGTGKVIDLDKYDKIYKHIVLWDEENLEIVGSYRLGVINEIIKNYGLQKIYNSELFNFYDDFIPILNKSVELGRSFVQMKYWGTNALDYLWQGIGAYLTENPEVKYLWGAVSISDSFHNDAKAMIVYYHQKWFKETKRYATSKNQFKLSENDIHKYSQIFYGENYNADFMILKKALRNYNVTCPVLLRKYVEICEYGGASFLDFGIDEGFANSIDCLILVVIEKLKPEFKKRYYKTHSEKLELA